MLDAKFDPKFTEKAKMALDEEFEAAEAEDKWLREIKGIEPMESFELSGPDQMKLHEEFKLWWEEQKKKR